MEQLGCSPRTPSITRRDTDPVPDAPLSLPEPIVNHSTATLTSTTSTTDLSLATPTPNPTSSRDPLSTSEPSLRFPRPQGNTHLANWISSSDPDIMRVYSTDDAGLSGSTYELVTGTDGESQDEGYIESMSESVSSLDFHRPDDDVNSLADTEQTFDNESIADGFEPLANPVHDVQDDEPDTTPLDQSARSQATVLGAAPDHDADAEYESEDDAASRTSLDYTQQSLKTPSIPTPEASRIVDRPAEIDRGLPASEEDEIQGDTTGGPLSDNSCKDVQERERMAWNMIMDTGFQIPPVVILVIALLIPVFFSATSPLSVPHSAAPLATHTSIIPTTAITTTTTTVATISTTTTTTTYSLSTATANVPVPVVPLKNVQHDDGIWGGKKPDLAVFKHQNGEFLVRIPDKIKYTWLLKNCLSFSANRGLHNVPISVVVAEDGMLIRFPQEERHGGIQVEISAQCRPKVHQVFRIAFEKGIMEEALERTKNFAQDLTDCLPAAAQEAERRIEEARRSLESASDNVLTASDNLLQDFMTRFRKAHRSLSPLKEEIKGRLQRTKEELSEQVDIIRDEVNRRLINTRDVRDQARLSLLDAQISAKLWWLKMTKNEDEHKRYANKAKEYLADKKAEAIKDFLSRHPNVNDLHLGPSQLWKRMKMIPGARCGNKLGRGRRMQQCKFMV